MRIPTGLATLLIVALSPAIAPAAMHVRGYNAERHARFVNSPDFIGAAHDFSGVGNSGRGWVTMISPSHFLTADHVGASGQVSFDRDDQIGNNPLVTRNVVTESLTRLRNPDGTTTDLLLGQLDVPLAPADGIASYGIAALPSTGDYLGRTQFVYGRGNGGTDSDRLGRNTIDNVAELRTIDPKFEPGSGGSLVTISNYDATGGSGDDETFLQVGDSGAPNFLVIDGALSLVGINWFNATADDGSNRWELSGSSFVPAHAQQINALIVPEPATVGMLAVALVSLTLGRRRVEKV